MLFNKLIIILFYFISLLSFALLKDLDDIDSVIFVNILFRHGDRTILNQFPTDPYNSLTKYWPEGLGQLTNIGKKEAFDFGLYVRKRYKKLIPKEYHRNDTYVRSTDVDRCLMTAESALAAIYPPEKKFVKCLKWQPIPVHTTPERLDSLLSMRKPCKQYDKDFKSLMESSEIKKINKYYENLYEYVTKKTGKSIENSTILQTVYDTLYIEKLRGYKLPKWTKSVYSEMSKVSAFSFRLQAYNKKLQRLKSGPLLGEMVNNMKDKATKKLTPDRVLFMYSAHDKTVANFLMTLGVFYTQSPPYTAAVFVQLHKIKKKYYVSVLYRNNTSKDPYLLQIPNCPEYCPLEEFIKLTKPLIPVDWEKECDN